MQDREHRLDVPGIECVISATSIPFVEETASVPGLNPGAERLTKRSPFGLVSAPATGTIHGAWVGRITPALS